MNIFLFSTFFFLSNYRVATTKNFQLLFSAPYLNVRRIRTPFSLSRKEKERKRKKKRICSQKNQKRFYHMQCYVVVVVFGRKWIVYTRSLPWHIGTTTMKQTHGHYHSTKARSWNKGVVITMEQRHDHHHDGRHGGHITRGVYKALLIPR